MCRVGEKFCQIDGGEYYLLTHQFNGAKVMSDSALEEFSRLASAQTAFNTMPSGHNYAVVRNVASRAWHSLFGLMILQRQIEPTHIAQFKDHIAAWINDLTKFSDCQPAENLLAQMQMYQQLLNKYECGGRDELKCEIDRMFAFVK